MKLSALDRAMAIKTRESCLQEIGGLEREKAQEASKYALRVAEIDTYIKQSRGTIELIDRRLAE